MRTFVNPGPNPVQGSDGSGVGEDISVTRARVDILFFTIGTFPGWPVDNLPPHIIGPYPTSFEPRILDQGIFKPLTMMVNTKGLSRACPFK
jgi:hypothetical protein